MRDVLEGTTLLARVFVARGARLWLGGRALLSAALLLAKMNPLNVSLTVSFLAIAGTAFLSWVEVRRRHERALWGNLAIPDLTISIIVATPAALGEFLLRVTWLIVR